MIRLLTGMMLNVVRGKVSMEQARACLHQQIDLKMVWSAPAQGLTLYGVDYEVEELPPFKQV
jgi:tRNA U38,U39,U40 pseudouridine synthase TruA